MKTREWVYTRFQRFWHWTQAGLIILLGITGFEIHGSFTLFGFERAVNIHNTAAWLLIGLIAFAIFWHFTTGQWKHYIPTVENLRTMIRYYLVGIFKNEPHPHKKSEVSKLNPLQRLTYLGFKLIFIPIQIITGLLYIFYNQWDAWGLNVSLNSVALIHTLVAFALTIFFIIHVYMTTTGQTVTGHIKAMITGWEEVEPEPAVARAD